MKEWNAIGEMAGVDDGECLKVHVCMGYHAIGRKSCKAFLFWVTVLGTVCIGDGSCDGREEEKEEEWKKGEHI